MYPCQDDFGNAVFRKELRLPDHILLRAGMQRSPDIRNNAVRAVHIAAVLHLQESSAVAVKLCKEFFRAGNIYIFIQFFAYKLNSSGFIPV